MSESSLFVINKDYFGEEICTYKNSWLFVPCIWRVLCKEYLKKEFSMFDNFIPTLNEKINNSDMLYDRICWELSMQQIFFSRNKTVVAQAIRTFIKCHSSEHFGESHIERFEEIAKDIENIDENEYPFFVFKNTSCDDHVESWFCRNGSDISLKDASNLLCEFVVIEDGQITDFISNIEFDYENGGRKEGAENA